MSLIVAADDADRGCSRLCEITNEPQYRFMEASTSKQNSAPKHFNRT